MPPTFPENKEKLFAYMTIHDFFDIYILITAFPGVTKKDEADMY